MKKLEYKNYAPKKMWNFSQFFFFKYWYISHQQLIPHHYTWNMPCILCFSAKKWKIFFIEGEKNLCKIWYRKKIVCSGWSSCDNSKSLSLAPCVIDSLFAMLKLKKRASPYVQHEQQHTPTQACQQTSEIFYKSRLRGWF